MNIVEIILTIIAISYLFSDDNKTNSDDEFMIDAVATGWMLGFFDD